MLKWNEELKGDRSQKDKSTFITFQIKMDQNN